jgi:hypothetical protein
MFESYSLSDSCSVCVSFSDAGEMTCSLGVVDLEGGVGLVRSDSSSRIQ